MVSGINKISRIEVNSYGVEYFPQRQIKIKYNKIVGQNKTKIGIEQYSKAYPHWRGEDVSLFS